MLTDRQKNLIRAHYGDLSLAAWAETEASLAAGDLEFDFEGLEAEYGAQAEQCSAEGAAAPSVTREDAMKFMAKGRTSAGLLADAARPAAVALVAAQAGAAPRQVRSLLLALSAAVGELEAQGVTAPDCWRALGWSLDFAAEVLGVAAGGAR